MAKKPTPKTKPKPMPTRKTAPKPKTIVDPGLTKRKKIYNFLTTKTSKIGMGAAELDAAKHACFSLLLHEGFSFYVKDDSVDIRFQGLIVDESTIRKLLISIYARLVSYLKHHDDDDWEHADYTYKDVVMLVEILVNFLHYTVETYDDDDERYKPVRVHEFIRDELGRWKDF